MATKVGIANLALTALGADAISSFTDPDSENARKINRVYASRRRATLRKHFWNFALKEAQLAKVSGVPVLDDFTDIFQLPSDFVRIKKTDLDEENGERYKIKGRRIYCNADTLKIEYIYDCDDPNLYDDEFIEAFAADLAAFLAYAITDNATLATAAKKEASDSLKHAKSTNSQEGTIDKPRSGSWIRGR